jgi:signal transduction histidine kinase
VAASAPARIAAAALGPLAAAIAYYLGCQLGFVLRFPPALTSILWPPNAILTAALLLSPPRHWWRFLLATFPAHVAVQMQVGFPVPLILALYATNCLEALVGAGLAHRLSTAPNRFDTLGRAALFVLSVVLVAPVVSGSVDAVAVAVLRGEPYLSVWRTRFFSNTLTALALVPVIVSLVQSWPTLRAVSFRRRMEAVGLILLLVAVGGAIFAHPLTRTGQPLQGGEQSLVLLLPLLLWAATRFGAAGSSCALLCTALIAFLAATSRGGSGSAAEAAKEVRVLQAFLLTAGIPLFGLGALMEERRSIERALEERLRFEAFLSRLSAAFVHLPSHVKDNAFEAQLRQVGEHTGLAYVLLFRLSSDRQRLELASSWSAAGSLAGWPPSSGTLSELFEHAASHEDWSARDAGGGWALGIPLEAGDLPLGALVFGGAGSSERNAPDTRLRLIAEVFSSALERQRVEEDARVSRAELAHFLRVSTVGELTTSLAHELNQPLTAILANAQAARQLLGDEPGADEMREILSDIVEEDKRAGEVIRRLRDLLRKGAPEYASLDLNALAADVVRLVGGDATLRNVTIRLQMAPAPAPVKGDRVQIQQVLLNLLLNAMDAMTHVPVEKRVALVSTAVAAEEGSVHLAVRDTGSGLQQGETDRVFEPFYTTKPSGMGMGLSIARSIIAAHGGRIWARNNTGAGATFTVSLPLTVPPDHGRLAPLRL